MAEATIKTIPRVYLKNPDINTTSAYHTARVGEQGNPSVIHTLVFVKGVARDVPVNVYERFRDMGVATTDRPRRRVFDDEEG